MIRKCKSHHWFPFIFEGAHIAMTQPDHSSLEIARIYFLRDMIAIKLIISMIFLNNPIVSENPPMPRDVRMNAHSLNFLTVNLFDCLSIFPSFSQTVLCSFCLSIFLRNSNIVKIPYTIYKKYLTEISIIFFDYKSITVLPSCDR